MKDTQPWFLISICIYLVAVLLEALWTCGKSCRRSLIIRKKYFRENMEMLPCSPCSPCMPMTPTSDWWIYEILSFKWNGSLYSRSTDLLTQCLTLWSVCFYLKLVTGFRAWSLYICSIALLLLGLFKILC